MPFKLGTFTPRHAFLGTRVRFLPMITSRLTNLRSVWFVLKSTIANARSSLYVGEPGVPLAVLHQPLIVSGNGQLQTRMENRSLPKLPHPFEVECGAGNLGIRQAYGKIAMRTEARYTKTRVRRVGPLCQPNPMRINQANLRIPPT